MQNPLFPTGPGSSQDLPDYLRTGSAAAPSNQQQSPMQHSPSGTQAPTSYYPPAQNQQSSSGAATAESNDNAAINVIRQKLANIYAEEPSAQQEIAEISAIQTPLSKHQLYMQQLNSSGRSFADIQTAWHEYYNNLPEHEKHEVWHEFHAANQTATPYQQQAQQMQQSHQPQPAASIPQEPATYQPVQPSSPYNLAPAATNPISPAALKRKSARLKDSAKEVIEKHKDKAPTIKDLKQKVKDTVSAQGKLKKKQHIQSLVFGLGVGAVTVFIFLFSFFNEVLLSPFIQPSRTATETPVIVDPASAVVGSTPKVIIPKINVEIPTDYSVTSASNAAVEAALDNGVVHYPTTVRPGQAGNAAFFGHSSNNLFNPGKYKFAFVLLHKLVEGDTFYLTYEGKTYAYQVITRRVVDPSEISVLGPVEGQTATATLITCDPPGTSLKRLVVVGRQISPDPAGNVAPGAPSPQLAATEPANQLAGNGPTLWGRIWRSIF